MRKAVKVFIRIVLPVILVLILIVLIALPYGIRKYINDHGSEYTGRKITVNDIKINYFTATFSMMGFKLFEADGQTAFVAFDSLQVKISPLPLFASKLVVRQIRLIKPEVNIVRKDTGYNFDDIIAFLNSKLKPDSTAKPSAPIRYFLSNIDMEQGKFVFDDKTVDDVTALNDLRFLIPSLNFDQDEINNTGIKFHFLNGGFLQAKAEYNGKTGSYNADFSLEKLDIAPFLPYAKCYYKIKSMNGLIGGNFHLFGNVSQPDSVLITGKGDVTGFTANDLTGHKVLGAGKINVTINDTWPMKFNFNFGSMQLSDPYLYVEMKDSTINLLNLIVESPADTVPFTYSYKFNQLSIEGGQIDIRDNSFEEPFDYHLSEIALKADSVSSDSKWLNMYSSMRLNKRGKLQAELGFNPSDPYEMKVDYVITNFQLPDLNIYSRHYVGFPILLGNMYYKGKTVIKGRQLSSENKLIVRDARLGKKSGGIFNLPLKLALYLLKDIHGDINLDLPLTGDLNNPGTRIGRLVWQMLKNVVVKVVASPFIALSGLMGVEPAEMKGIEFNYADTTLTATHMKRIRLFTELEQKKPDMKIELIHYNDNGLERKEIAVAEAGKLFQAATGKDYKKDETGFRTFISGKPGSDTLNIETGCIRLVGAHRVDSLQRNYSLERIRKIEMALRSFDDSTKIKVVVPDNKVPENVGSRPVFELKYAVDE
jgi:hypothetical protein